MVEENGEEKEEGIMRQKKEPLRKKQEEKETFIKKFFPSCNNSPGGTFRLRGEDRNNKNSTECVAMEKIQRRKSGTTLPTLEFNLSNEKVKIGSDGGHSIDTAIKLFGETGRTKKADLEKEGISGNRGYLG